MKKSSIIGGALALVGLAAAPAYAQPGSTARTTQTSTTTEFVQSSKIIGSKIRAADGSEVGTIKDIVLDRETGCMAYTVLETTGGDAGRTAGTSGSRTKTTTTTTTKSVALPWTAVDVGPEPGIYTTQIQRERIYSAPAYDYARVEEYHRPEYISGIYSHYGVQPAVGVNLNFGSSRTGVTTQTGVAGQTAPTPMPTATATSAPVTSPTPIATPTATATATATASPTATPTATGTPIPVPTVSPGTSPAAKAPTATPAATTKATAPGTTAKPTATPAAATGTTPNAATRNGPQKDTADDDDATPAAKTTPAAGAKSNAGADKAAGSDKGQSAASKKGDNSKKAESKKAADDEEADGGGESE